jgi:hypothetical protein
LSLKISNIEVETVGLEHIPEAPVLLVSGDTDSTPALGSASWYSDAEFEEVLEETWMLGHGAAEDFSCGLVRPRFLLGSSAGVPNGGSRSLSLRPVNPIFSAAWLIILLTGPGELLPAGVVLLICMVKVEGVGGLALVDLRAGFANVTQDVNTTERRP